MAEAQKRMEGAAAKTAHEMVEASFVRFSDRARNELREEVRDLLASRQLQDMLTDAWAAYCSQYRISEPDVEDLNNFMDSRGRATIWDFLSSEQNRARFALLQTFEGEMAYEVRRGRVILTGYDAETHLDNYLGELRARTEDAVSCGLGTYVDPRTGGKMEASIGSFELPEAAQATIDRIAELFNSSIGYSGAQTSVSALPRGRVPALIDPERNAVSWSPSVQVESG